MIAALQCYVGLIRNECFVGRKKLRKQKYEQISFDDLFQAAEQKREKQVHMNKPTSPEHIR